MTFTTADPIRDGHNWYVYVNNNPVNWIDEWGLERKVNPMVTSDQGINFIKNYEQFKSEPYKVTKDGNATIGYGHEIKDGEDFTVITEKEAIELLKKDLKWIEDGINKNYAGKKPLTQEQFDAMVSLGINAGRSGLIKSDVFKNAEAGETNEQKILDGFRTKNTSRGKYMLGLDLRRYDEVEIYLYGDYKRNDDVSLDNPKKEAKIKND